MLPRRKILLNEAKLLSSDGKISADFLTKQKAFQVIDLFIAASD